MLKLTPNSNQELEVIQFKFNYMVVDITKGLYSGEVEFNDKGGLKFKVNKNDILNGEEFVTEEFVIEL